MTTITTARASHRFTPAAVAAAAGIIALVFVLLRLATYDWNPTGFVWASDRVVDTTQTPPNLLVRDDISGFDGTGFYRFALDPVTRERTDFGILLDHPAFRHQRIAYPLLAWALGGGGNPIGVAWALIAINIAGLMAIAWLGAALARGAGRHEAWGLAFAANPAFALALGVDTAEIVAGAGLLGGLLALRRARWGAAAVVLTLAMFARETTLILAAGGIAAALLRRGRDRPPMWVFATPIAVYVLWQVLLGVWWRGFALGSGAGLDIGPPFAGIASGVAAWTPPQVALDGLHLVLLIAIVGFAVTALRSAARGAGPVHERATLVLSAVLIALTSEAIWFHHWGFLRATAELYLLGTLAILTDARGAAHRLLVAPAIVASVWVNMLLFP
jgi:hypothetical protein